MNFFHLSRALVAAFALVLATATGRADIKDYEFRLLEDGFQPGDAVVAVRLIDKRSGQPVSGAEIVARRMDMEPDGMAEMTTSLDILPVSEPGLYRFKTNLTMGGRWRLSLTANVPGESGVLQSSLVVKAVSAPVPAQGKGRLLYYRNPMGLPDTSPVPKKDSMGMDYLPVYEGEDGDGTTIKLSPGRVQRSGVRSELVSRQAMTRTIRVPGVVQLDERLISVVALRADAFIQEVAPVTTGDRVSKGARLARIYSPDISAASAQFVTELSAATRGALEGGARQRLENLGVPSAIVAEIERTRKVPSTLNWTAPRDGIVLERNIVDGMKVVAGSTLFRLADLSTVWVVADVPEGDLAAIGVGTSASVQLRGRPESRFTGRIGLIYPQVAEATRTVKVRIELANPEGLLLPNMFAEVDIRSGDAAPVLVVPDSAVIDSGTRRVVILDRGEGRFEAREVAIGLRGDGMVAIRDGVNDGDRVVVAANFLIDAESNLKAALRTLSMTENQP
ncbi:MULTISPECIES: efflux RND transporter periplasmic adaptor subunit [unclassified Beijerinckia]|uniref:efflux RND transporter periplasmic adaptor subunit n=1 Tax=unclassified Beijerinckia TaxID=2638183 RepID=UPI0008997E13|nr:MULTISPECIES: efflux RND transporter periplasmic adaptor subunit [unclassified Beijerinckia]MDH7794958.1 Cu(I)/Ag(I) efflux system membrane fusion protein [Beijerinckia sp. GAS462]SEB81920.1 membrane fusion protein, Cu(I)/Ag(I) efflux system [Beijerinckia sp. 28-YEA-48]